MKAELSAFDVHFLVKELKSLEGGKLDSIFASGKQEWYFQFHKQGKQILSIHLPSFMFLTEQRQESQPSTFCMFLRKRIEQSRVLTIEQYAFERVVTMRLQSKEAQYILVIELFSKGNLILCDEAMKILGALEPQEWKSRTIKKDEQYKYPERAFSILSCTHEQLAVCFQGSSRATIAASLATDVGLSGPLAEEVCVRAGITKSNSPKQIGLEESKKILTHFAQMLALPLEPRIYTTTESKHVTPVRFRMYEGLQEQSFESFSAALGHYWSALPMTIENPQRKKLLAILEAQRKQLTDVEQDITLHQSIGDYLYEHYQEFNDFLQEAARLRKQNKLNPEIVKGIRILSVDSKKSAVTIEKD